MLRKKIYSLGEKAPRNGPMIRSPMYTKRATRLEGVSNHFVTGVARHTAIFSVLISTSLPERSATA
jgi:hypothetical protein